MLHNYPESKAFFPSWDAFALVQVEDLEVHHDGRLFRLDSIEQGLCRHGRINQKRHVADDWRESRRRRELRQRQRLKGLRIQLEKHHRAGELVLLLPLRMELADPADFIPAQADPSP